MDCSVNEFFGVMNDRNKAALSSVAIQKIDFRARRGARPVLHHHRQIPAI
jgi:hypothetical protein